ncbi:ornithine transcarbamylase, mitochondrial-like [Styela clava]
MWIHRTLPRCNTLRCVTHIRKQSTSPKSVASTNHAQICRQQDISMKGRSLLSLADYTREDLLHLLSSAADLKLRMKQLNERFRKLEGKSLGMIFEKTSTRTKISTEIGMNLLGGHSCVIPYEDVQSNANGGSEGFKIMQVWFKEVHAVDSKGNAGCSKVGRVYEKMDKFGTGEPRRYM